MADSFLKLIDQSVQALIYLRFKTIMGYTNMNKDSAIWTKEVSMRHIAEKRGEHEVEFFNVWRETVGLAWDRQRSPLARRGLMLNFNDGSKSDIRTSKAMPVNLGYRFWLWSQDLDKINKAIESYLFWQHQNPNLNMSYDGTYPIELDMHFADVVDESPINTQFDRGLYFVYSFYLGIDGWVLTDFNQKTVKKIIIKLWDDVEAPGEDVLLREFSLVLTSDSGSFLEES
jgi:hypothetical protein